MEGIIVGEGLCGDLGASFYVLGDAYGNVFMDEDGEDKVEDDDNDNKEDEESIEYKVEEDYDFDSIRCGRSGGFYAEDAISLNHLVNIRKFDIHAMTTRDVAQLDFCDLKIAYQFYCWYAKLVGFFVRMDHIVRNKFREIV